MLLAVKGLPRQPWMEGNEGDEPEVCGARVEPGENEGDKEKSGVGLGDPAAEFEPSKPRDFRITWKSLEQFGATGDCRACAAYRAGIRDSRLGHSQACRRIVEEKVKNEDRYEELL